MKSISVVVQDDLWVSLTITMKIIVVLALAGLAMAEPEADPQYFPYRYGYHAVHAYTPYQYYRPTTAYYGKRDADAEADPQVVLNNYGYGLHPSTLYNVPVVQKTVVKNAVATPVVYNNLHSPLVYTSPLHPTVYSTPLVNAFPPFKPLTPAVVQAAVHTPLVNVFPNLKTLKTPAVESKIAKREADPQVIAHTVPLAGHYPVVYNTAVHTKVVPKVYSSPVHTPMVHTPLVKTVDNAVVLTSAGLIHSSHAGICTNNVGIRVPC